MQIFRKQSFFGLDRLPAHGLKIQEQLIRTEAIDPSLDHSHGAVDVVERSSAHHDIGNAPTSSNHLKS